MFGKVLVVDNNTKFIDASKANVEAVEKYSCVFVKTFQEGNKLLLQYKQQVRAVFLSTSLGATRGIEELRQVRILCPNVPVFLISHDPVKEPTALHDEGLACQGIIKEPKSFEGLSVHLKALFSADDWAQIAPDAVEKNQTINSEDSKYVSTPISHFILTKKSFFNLYIRLSASKYIKIVNASEPLNQELLASYRAKGVNYLYITEKEHRKYLQFCDELSKKIIASGEVASDKKVEGLLNFGAKLVHNLKLKGVTTEKMDTAESYLTQSIALVRTMKIENKDFRRYFALLQSKDHSSTVAFLAGLIGNEVGLESSKCVKIVGIAALLHDLGLYALDPDFDETKKVYNDVDIEIFKKHAEHGAKLLRELNTFDESICQAVELHHFRRRHSDPAKRSTNVNIITEVIGASDDLCRVLQHQKDKEMWGAFLEVELKYFSPQIEKAVLKILGIKAS